MKQKAFFIVFDGLSFAEKNKNFMKIADTSFKKKFIKIPLPRFTNKTRFSEGPFNTTKRLMKI